MVPERPGKHQSTLSRKSTEALMQSATHFVKLYNHQVGIVCAHRGCKSAYGAVLFRLRRNILLVFLTKASLVVMLPCLLDAVLVLFGAISSISF